MLLPIRVHSYPFAAKPLPGKRAVRVAVSLTTFIVVAIVASLSPAAESPAVDTVKPLLSRFEFTQPQMGVPWKIIVYAEEKSVANLAVESAFKRVSQLNDILSDYDLESELSRLGQSSPHATGQKVSDDLWNVLERSQALAKQSGGAFDITVGPLVKQWRRARRQQALPSPEKLAEARKTVGYQFVELDVKARTVRLLKPNMRLDVGGIGMGYAADEALKVLIKHGIASAMVDASGDVVVSDAPPGSRGWRIGIDPDTPEGPPSRYLLLANAAVTTSGDAFQHIEFDGVRYSHILDPRTGIGLTDRCAVTVIGPDCMTADSLTKVVAVLGPDSGLKFVKRLPGVEALIVRSSAIVGHPQLPALERVETPNFAHFEEQRPRLAPSLQD